MENKLIRFSRAFLVSISIPGIFLSMRRDLRFNLSGILYASSWTGLGALFCFCSLQIRLQQMKITPSDALRQLPLYPLLLDVFLKVAALAMKFGLNTEDNYEIMHSYGWHIPAFLSFYLTMNWCYIWNRKLYDIETFINEFGSLKNAQLFLTT
eukprot:snap_masked-scaffold_1-processed-gene-29.6-mRNA-1 protein AED:1.00 eAED:1.00 QI:0/-1/0/0/-1/1/1/0/152